jgi:hypothetical protein
MKYRFVCEYDECRRHGDVELSDLKIVETIRNQDGSIQQYIITCPHCGVRQALAAWRVHDASP